MMKIENGGRYYFLNDRSRDLCHQIIGLTAAGAFPYLIQKRIELLMEHFEHCRDAVTKRRMMKTINYQRKLLINPDAVYDSRPVLRLRRDDS